jgi:hypothetical protein
VDAETLYEAVALAVAEFRQDQINESSPGTMTEFHCDRFPQAD